MKKILVSLLLVVAMLFSLCSCSMIEQLLPYVEEIIGGIGGNQGKTYVDFTPAEKDLIKKQIGCEIKFIPNNEYYLESYSHSDEKGVNFYTFGNTQSEFTEYRDILADYSYLGSHKDTYGTTWYFYENDGVFYDIAFYQTDDGYDCIDLYVYTKVNNGNQGGNDDTGSGGSGNDDGGNDNTGSGGNSGNQNTGNYAYTSFSASEIELFNEFCDFVIPFIPNNEYYVEGYTFDDEVGINYYTFGNTASDFSSYKSKFSVYTYVESFTDDYGDIWYTYQKGEFYIDISYYYYDAEYGYCVDVYVYTYSNADDGSGNDGGNNGGNSGGSGTSGLPDGEGGVANVDFTKAKNVKDVTDQGYYLDGCPTKGSPAVLVIPVEFKDATASSKGYTTEAIKNAFLKDGECDYYSVYDYYYISSYGQLSLDITVLDYWFKPQYSSSYYANATTDYYGDEMFVGDQMIMDEALAYLSTFMDLSEFDSDGNSIIDAVVLINTLEIGDNDFNWAYRYWNYYTDSDGYYYEYDGVSANDYLWASYQFLHEADDGQDFDDPSAMNTYTFIHEFGHVLGADDYYDTAGIDDPMGGCDIMDIMKGDHNAFTKFNYGWITTSRLVVTDTSVTLTLEDFSKNGDTIIIANSWDEKLGAYQEYYIVMYYTSNGLNDPDVGGGYFARDGIVVYHVNAELYEEEHDGTTYYDIYNNNTNYSDEYGTKDNLIEFVVSGNDTYTYVVGDTLPTVTDDNGNTLGYTFTVDALGEEYATITFTKR